MEKIQQESGRGKENEKVLDASPAGAKTYSPSVFNPVWVPTHNEAMVNQSIEIVRLAGGPGFITISGPAGEGKSTIIMRKASFDGSIYLLCLETWRRSELPMLQALCKELGSTRIPARANDCFQEAMQKLLANPRVVFFDEIDLVPSRINLIRQLADVTGSIFVLVGEESLTDHLRENERTWSRVFIDVHFEPASPADIMTYARESAGLEIGKDEALIAHRSPKGKDWRIIKRITIALVQLANARKTRIVTASMMNHAVEIGLTGKMNGGPVKGGEQ